MGQKRITAVDLSTEEKAVGQPVKPKTKKAAKAVTREKGTGRLVDMGAKMLEEQEKLPETEKKEKVEAVEEQRKPVQKRERGRKYKQVRAMVDRTKTYPLPQAIELVKKTSYTTFNGTVAADVVVKVEQLQVEVAFPYPTGKQTRVAVADEKLLKQIEKEKIDFDVLLATPDIMPKLAKYAKVLGPKGLMPNPKNGTITDKPEERKQELEKGKAVVKTEKKAPLIHVVLGKTNQKEKELVSNVEALIKAIGGKRIKKLVLSSTMSPGVKVDLTAYQTA